MKHFIDASGYRDYGVTVAGQGGDAMVMPEMMQEAMQERMLEIARLQAERRAQALCGLDASGRQDPSGMRLRRLSLPSFVERAFRGAQAS